MSLFSKAEYLELTLPFHVVILPEDWEACSVSIEAYGSIMDEMKYCNIGLWANPEYYDELVKVLKNGEDKRVKLKFKIKNGKIKNMKLDIDSLADAFQDERIREMELLGWGCNDKSILQLEQEWKKGHGYK